MTLIRRVPLFAISLLLLAAGGCDPEGPGADGYISLGGGVSTSGFTLLNYVAYPDPGGSYINECPPYGSFPGHTDMAAGLFPFDYSNGRGPDTMDDPYWRVLAWISDDSSSSFPAPGDPFGTTPYQLEGCGSFGGYCGYTEGVDVVINGTWSTTVDCS